MFRRKKPRARPASRPIAYAAPRSYYSNVPIPLYTDTYQDFTRRMSYARRQPRKKKQSTLSKIGQYVGQAATGFAKGVGQAIISGMGDYEVSSNTLWQQMNGNDPPQMKNTRMNSVFISHREYLGDIVSSSVAGDFELSSYPINIGLSETFPWGHSIGTCFEQYRVLGMVFQFKTTSSDALNSTNTALGKVIMATQYNSADPDFSSSQQMLNHTFCTSGKPSQSLLHPIECNPNQTPIDKLYTRGGEIDEGTDIRLYDLGNFQIASMGMQGTSVRIGELWVSYEVELFKPTASNVAGFDVQTDHFSLVSVGNADPLGNDGTEPYAGSMGGTIENSGTEYHFPVHLQVGCFLVSYSVVGGSTAVTGPNITGTGLTILSMFKNNQATSNSNTGTTTGVYMINIVVQLNAQNCYLTFGAATLPTSPTSADLHITQWDSHLALIPKKHRLEITPDLLNQLVKLLQAQMSLTDNNNTSSLTSE